MNAKTQRAKNHPARRRNARFSTRSLCLFWVAGLLLATTGTALPATFKVSVGDGADAFAPANLTIHAGDTVQWDWADPQISHTVTSGKDGKASGLFDSLGHRAPFTFSFTFTDVGTFEYFCRFH